MEVVFTPRAEAHIDALHLYIAEQSGFESRADRYIQRIIDYCLSFSTFPLRGTQRDDILPGLRVIGFERRVMIAFMVTSDLVIIEGVFYGGQDYEGAFEP